MFDKDGMNSVVVGFSRTHFDGGFASENLNVLAAVVTRWSGIDCKSGSPRDRSTRLQAGGFELNLAGGDTYAKRGDLGSRRARRYRTNDAAIWLIPHSCYLSDRCAI